MNQNPQREPPRASYPPPYRPRRPYPVPTRRRRRRGQVYLPRLPIPTIRAPRLRYGCIAGIALVVIGITLILGSYLLFPMRHNVMLLGIDFTETGSVARTDTIILSTFDPFKPYVGLLSIPRDLWVQIPDLGENRINTAHFYAEGQRRGSGPQAVRRTVALNFGLDIPYYVRIRFHGFRNVIDAMGGIDIVLTEPMAGYPPGRHHLTGRKALAFVRSRQYSDDFHRMAQGQLMIKAILKNLLNPLKWYRIPAAANAFFSAVDTNIPLWMWPRLALALLRAGPSGIDSRVIDRDLAPDFTTDLGASILLPDWGRINPVVKEMFGK